MPGHRLPAARAELAARAGLADLARSSYDEALVVCSNAAEQRHLERRRADL
ncbi:hypothetical protein [Nocardioides psychrotolerans]|uniref:hypothetical protein n=1 Tax=Nocardioides psychrotolerans TaxID=1005945 RepID=UPI001FED089D|nr:hypothetical protein [Nocardioides psychrotolerans]